MVTASRPGSGALSTQFIHAVEKVRPEVVDIVRKEITALNVAKEMGFYKETSLSHAEIDPIIESNDVPVTRFSTGFETLPINAVKGAQGAYIEYANYAAPVAMSWVEEQKITAPYEVVDLADTRTYKAAVKIGQELEQDFFWGTASNSLSIAGLEQALPPTNGTTITTVALILAAARWKFRAAANTYLGLARAAFTAEDTTGTGWEGNAANVSDAHLTDLSAGLDISISSGAPSSGLKIINKFYNVCKYGNDVPNLMMSTYAPYEQYQNAVTGVIQYRKTDETTQRGNLGVGGCWFKDAWWVASERAGASGLVGDATAAWNMIYFLNTKWLRFEVSRKANFEKTDFTGNAGQLAAACQIVFRGQFIMDNPRSCGVLFGFGN